jgi:UPF0271 protein
VVLFTYPTIYGVEIQHVKPHGQLYNMAWTDEALARAILEPIQMIKPEPIFLALYNTIPYEMTQSMGIWGAGEFYADLDYAPDGTTFIKRIHGEIDSKATVEKVLKMVLEERVTASDGKEIEVKGKSICFHGDSPKSPEIVQIVRKELEKRAVKIVPLGQQSYP